MSNVVGWTLVVADAGGWDHMGGWRGGMATGGLILMLALVGLLAWLVAILVGRSERSDDGRSGLDVLDDRYARGEIDREEFLQRRDDLRRLR